MANFVTFWEISMSYIVQPVKAELLTVFLHRVLFSVLRVDMEWVDFADWGSFDGEIMKDRLKMLGSVLLVFIMIKVDRKP